MGKREQVVSAARQLLATRGLHGMSMKLLVQESGVAAGTIYLHFENKQDILRQVHANVLEEVATAINEGHDSEQPLFDQYRRLWRNLWSYFVNNRNTLLVKSQFDHLPDAAVKEDLEKARDWFLPIVELFENGRRSGELIDLPDQALGVLSFETCSGLARQHLLGLVQVDEDMLEQCIRASWKAISQSSDAVRNVENLK